MFKTPSFLQSRPLTALVVLSLLAACSGSCPIPAFRTALAPGATPTPRPPGSTPTPPGATPTPPGPTPTPTAPPTPSLACNQGAAAISLGPALAPFALLAAAGITNVGNTLVTYAPGAITGSIHDDLIGVSPGTAVSGFYPLGTDTDGPNAIYAITPPGFNTDRAVPLAAQGALTTAYNAAAGRPATATVSGDLSQATVPGHPTGTLPPGVYKSAVSSPALEIRAGNLTLDGGGNPQSVFIFQVGSTLTTLANGGTSGNVILTGNASACNIYWQMGSSATLGGATFYGNVLALASVTINAPAFTGRALARTAAVTIPVAAGSLITNPGGQ